MGDGASTIALYATAIAGLVWVLTPAIAFSLGLIRLRSDVNPDPAGAEPKGDDPDYERRFRQFEALGFRAAGTSRESCWFMNPHRWRWKQHGGYRWMTSPDGKVTIALAASLCGYYAIVSALAPAVRVPFCRVSLRTENRRRYWDDWFRNQEQLPVPKGPCWPVFINCMAFADPNAPDEYVGYHRAECLAVLAACVAGGGNGR
jgi:hypothetical protein